MWKSLSLGVIQKKISNRIFLSLAAVILIGGFFITYQVLATHTATVDLTIKKLGGEVIGAIDVNQTVNAEIAVVKMSGSSLGAIKISYPADFIAPTSITCPAGFASSEINTIGKYVKCAMGAGAPINSGTVILNSIQASPAAGEKTFSVEISDVDYDKETTSKPATVKNLTANITIGPASTNVSQEKTYTLGITNSGEDGITQINGTLTDFSISACSASGWITCTPVGSSFTLSGGTLASSAFVDVSVTATAPATHGARAVSAAITGALGGTTAISVSPSVIQAQTPANLTIGAITVDHAFISKNTGAINKAVISAQVGNTGEATANLTNRNLILKDSGGNDITSDFIISSPTDIGDNAISGGAGVGTDWNVIRWERGPGGSFAGPVTVEIILDYDDVNDSAPKTPVAKTETNLFTVDNTAPTISLTAPSSGNAVNASAIIAFTNDSDATPLIAECSVDNTSWTVCTTGVTALSAIPQFTDLAQGAFTLYIKDADLAGNIGTDSEAGIIKDTTLPTFSGITALQSPAKLGTEITVSFTAGETLVTDPTVTIGGGAAAKDLTSAPPVYVYKRTLDGTETEGRATVSISGADSAGNVGTDTTRNITTDFTAPTVNLTYNPDRQVKNSDSVTIIAAFSENLNGTPKISIDTPTTDVANVDMSGSGMIWTYPWNVPAGDGSAIITITASDPAGNPNSPATNNTRIIDNTKPTSTINSPAASSWQNTNFTVSLTDEDTGGSGVKTCKYRIRSLNGASWVATKDLGVRTCSSIVSVSVGVDKDCRNQGENKCKIQSIVIDNAGNEITDGTVEKIFSIDWVPPDAATISIDSGAVVTKDATPTLTLTPGAIEPDFMRFSCNGADWSSQIAWATSYSSFNLNTGAGCSASDGLKTVYVRVEDTYGNIQTTVNSDTIIYDSNNTLTVGSGADFSTIQAAIDAASSGNTINVSAGIYTENVNVNKSLTLTGAGSSSVTVTAANPAVSVFNVTVSSVNISGFTVSGATGAGQAGIYLGSGLSNCNFSNNTLTGNYDGVWLGSGSHENTLTNNTANSNTTQGFEVYISSNNTFADNTANSNTKYGFKIDSGDHNTFTHNTANSNLDKGFYSVAGDGGGSTNSIFTNNTANLNTRHGLHLIGSNIGTTLTGNTFNSNGTTGVKLQDVVTGLNMRNNNITNNPTGVGIDSSVSGVDGLIVTHNNIFGNTSFGISNAGAGILNATSTWWGDSTGPHHSSNPLGTGNAVSNNVSFRPWYITSAMTGLDSTSPTPIIISNATSPTNLASISMIVNFGESVTGFEVGDLTVGNGTPSDFAGSGASYTFNITPITDGAITVDIAGSVAQDLSGNYNNAATPFSIMYDHIPPVISALSVSPSSGMAKVGSTITLNITADAAGYTADAITINGVETTSFHDNGDNTYTATYTVAEGNTNVAVGAITVNVVLKDSANNENTPFTTVAGNTLSIDANTPVISSLTSDAVSAGWLKVGDTISFTLTTAITESGATVSGSYNGAVLSWSTSNNGVTYTATYTVVEGNADRLTMPLQITDVTITDSAGNISSPASSSNVAKTIDAHTPTLTLGSLFSGQTLTGGHVYPINWTSSDANFSSAPISLEYSIDGGATWGNTIVASTENDGVYSWIVPAINSSSVKIKITSADLAGNATSTLSGLFTIAYSEIVDITPPVVTLNSPNGTESYQGGSAHVITWTATDNVTPAGSLAIKLEYSTDGSAHWNEIIASTENDGAYLWTATTTATANALIKITAKDMALNAGSDLSNAVFTISAQPVNICHQIGSTSQWTCDISLNAGWNLISLPVASSTTAISRVLGGISFDPSDVVQYYDNSTDTWKYYNPSTGLGDLTTIEDGKGYWLSRFTPATLTVTGMKAPSAPALPRTYNVASGWNLIGFKSTITQPTSTYLQSLPIGGYSLLNASDENKTAGFMDSGQGYWLWMNADGSIATYSE